MLEIDEIAGFNELKSVNSSPDKMEYKKFGEDLFDSEILERSFILLSVVVF